MKVINSTDENCRQEVPVFTTEEISCLCVFWATVMTLMVLFQLSMIW
jgi:hypothetical protein